MNSTNRKFQKNLVAPLCAIALAGCSFAPFGQHAATPPDTSPKTRVFFDPLSGATYQLAMAEPLSKRAFPPVRIAATTRDESLLYPVPDTRTDAAPAVALIAQPKQPVAARVPQTVASLDSAPPTPLQLDHAFASITRMVPFAINRAQLGPIGRKAVNELIPIAQAAREVHVRGRTDASGNAHLNETLANTRAHTVASAFIDAGIARDKISTSECIDCYVATNDTAAGRRMNRRVDVEMALPKAMIAQLPAPVYALETPPLIMARTLTYPVTSARR